MIRRLYTLYHPELFQGYRKSKTYFEGWYYKMVTADGSRSIAIIPGFTIDDNGHKSAFIQLLDGNKNAFDNMRFDYSEFSSNPKTFDLRIAQNRFSLEGVTLDCDQIRGSIGFRNVEQWAKKIVHPSTMGFYSLLPRLDCYHHVLSINHTLTGRVEWNGEVIDFTGGLGYAEKEWGEAIPRGYIWMQSNHFGTPYSAFQCTIAHIPWLKSYFTGFSAGIWLNGTLISFSLFNRTRIKECELNNKHLKIVMENRHYLLNIEAKRRNNLLSVSPQSHFTEGRINESLTAILQVQLYDKRSKKVIFKENGHNSGLELVGEIAPLMKKKQKG